MTWVHCYGTYHRNTDKKGLTLSTCEYMKEMNGVIVGQKHNCYYGYGRKKRKCIVVQRKIPSHYGWENSDYSVVSVFVMSQNFFVLLTLLPSEMESFGCLCAEN